jgi:hypothetical protein
LRNGGIGFDGAGYAIVSAVCSSDECGALIPALEGVAVARKSSAHRRVLHVEYASESLPHGLERFEQCA